MTTGNAPTHTCSYFCDKPECIKAQRDELREKLAARESQPVPVEHVATVYDAYDTTGIDWHCKHPPAVGAKIYDQSAIDSLQSALKLAQEEHDRVQKILAKEIANHLMRAEKAEAINRRMVELLKEPSGAIIQAGADRWKSDGTFTDIFKAMSAELLKEVEK